MHISIRFLPAQQTTCLDMHGVRKHVAAPNLYHPVSAFDKGLKVVCKTCGLARNVDDPVNPVRDDLLKRLWMDALARRVEDYGIGRLFDRVEDLKYVTTDEFAVLKIVKLGVFTGRCHSLFHYLDADDLLCDRSDNLGYRPCSGIKVLNNLARDISEEITRNAVQYLGSE